MGAVSKLLQVSPPFPGSLQSALYARILLCTTSLPSNRKGFVDGSAHRIISALSSAKHLPRPEKKWEGGEKGISLVQALDSVRG
eukprot:scaffold8011_cov471-Prasinococcus_capsulatus_cf.AAC.1